MDSPTTKALTAWKNFWFAPTPAVRLGASRIAFFLGMGAFYLFRERHDWEGMDRVFFTPGLLFRALHLSPVSSATAEIFWIVWKVSLVLACLGLFTRVSITVFTVLGMYIWGLNSSMTHSHYMTHVTTVVIGAILAFSRCGDALSVDSWLRKRRGRSLAPRWQQEGAYHWPIMLSLVFFSLLFFSAGYSKLWTGGGISWITSDTIRHFVMMANAQYFFGNSEEALLAGFLARNPLLCHIMAGVTVVVELCYPLALFSRRLRPLFAVGGVGILCGFYLGMAVRFVPWMVPVVFWVPWERVLPWMGAKLGRRRPDAVAHQPSSVAG